MFRIPIALFGTAFIAAVLTDSVVRAQIQYPSGTEDFESMAIGDDVLMLGWPFINESLTQSDFTVRAVQTPTPPLGINSTRAVRILDVDAGNVQNRFYSPSIIAPSDQDYVWTFLVRLQATPPGAGASKPRFTIQHDSGGFANAWGIEFSDTGAHLIVTGIGGTAASTPLYSLASPTGLNQWVRIDLSVNFTSNTVSALVNGASPATLPINLTGDKKFFRFCYRGEGTGNVADMLLDHVSVNVGGTGAVPATSTWGLIVTALLLLATGTIAFNRRRAFVTA
jgi:hypothetical protein